MGFDGDPRIALCVLGSTALFLQTRYVRGTKDGDVFRTRQIDGRIEARLKELAGQGTELHRRHGIYLDVVSPNIPMLPHEPQWHDYDLELGQFEVSLLSVADVIVSKLKRWSGNDRDDVRAMIEGGHVEQAHLAQRFREVVDRYTFDARADLLPTMAARLNRAEEEWFATAATSFELPDDAFR